MTYRIEKYGADGCLGPSDQYVIARGVTSLTEARAIVRHHFGLARLTAARRWEPTDELGGGEAYHDFPLSHPRADGCGGVQIIEEDAA